MLHPKVVGVRHPLRARRNIPFDHGPIERLEHFDQPPEPRFFVRHVEHQRLVAPDIAELKKGVPMAEARLRKAAARSVVIQSLPHAGPVDRIQPVGLLGIRGQVAFERLPVRQRMFCHDTGDAVLRSVPHATPGIAIGSVLALDGRELRGKAGGSLKIGEQEGVPLHQLLQCVVRIVLPARGVDVKDHWDEVGALEAHAAKQVFSVVHSAILKAVGEVT